MRTTIKLVLFLAAVSAVSAQTVVDIQAKYGNPVDVYSVSEHIWMTPEYAADGQVCRMRLYPKRISSNTNYGAHNLPFSELRDVLNALVPVETRGSKKQFFGGTVTGGGAAWTTYRYENVGFTFVSFFSARSFDPVTLKRGEYVFPWSESEPLVTDSNPSSDDFVERLSPRTEIVTVIWNGRKCVAQ